MDQNTEKDLIPIASNTFFNTEPIQIFKSLVRHIYCIGRGIKKWHFTSASIQLLEEIAVELKERPSEPIAVFDIKF